ncbi:Fur family peroxide stress response transcriptional regulator [Anaerotaenia torta]
MILDVEPAHHEHPAADQIYAEVREPDPRISRGTVYRNLKRLADNGEIQPVKMVNGERLDYRQDLHYYLLCTSCGRLLDAPVPYQSRLDEMLSKETGIYIEQHRTVFEGLCPAHDYDGHSHF